MVVDRMQGLGEEDKDLAEALAAVWSAPLQRLWDRSLSGPGDPACALERARGLW